MVMHHCKRPGLTSYVIRDSKRMISPQLPLELYDNQTYVLNCQCRRKSYQQNMHQSNSKRFGLTIYVVGATKRCISPTSTKWWETRTHILRYRSHPTICQPAPVHRVDKYLDVRAMSSMAPKRHISQCPCIKWCEIQTHVL